MGELSSKFSQQDIETLLESMDDWELMGNQEYHFSQMIKSVPLPPEDHESYDVMIQVKEHFKKREKDIKRGRQIRQERATFLKCKLMMARNDLGAKELWDIAANAETEESSVPLENSVSLENADSSIARKLQLAEEFIADLGVKKHYETFLAERNSDQSE